MKKFFTLFVLGLLAASCAQKDPNFCYIEGKVSGPYEAEGASLSIAAMNENSSVIELKEDGTFSAILPADKTTIARVSLTEKDQRRAKYRAEFIPESGSVKIILDENIRAKGGSVNRAYDKFKEYSRELATEFNALDMDDPASEAKREKLVKAYQGRCEKLFADNADNWVGLMALTNLMYDLSLEELDAHLAVAADFIRDNQMIQDFHASLEAQANTAEGRPFVDFSGVTPEGKPASLSDFVGRGNYTLVDFWASWCGPCRQEMPNIRDLYRTFHPRGLDVLSVAVWDNDNSQSRVAIQEMEMTWNHLFMGMDKTPTERYGIFGIPHLILFAPDGTIYKRGLRGDELRDTIAELFN